MNTEDLGLPGYRMIGTLGEGGFGQVFRALHEASGTEVAVKVVLDDQNPEALGRFQDEARILAALNGQNVPKALEMGLPPKAPVPYLAMELIDGVAMSDLLRAQATVPGRLEVLRHVLPGVCKGLRALHAQGAVHRDLKPENMMWRRSDREGVLIDLGLVKAGYLPPKTATGFVLGTPAFMAPEQLTGQTKVYGGETDVYQLGLVILLALEGRSEDPDVHEIDAAVRRCTHGVERRDERLAALGISPELADWIRGATEPIPDGRSVGLSSLPSALASSAPAAPRRPAAAPARGADTQPSRIAPSPAGPSAPADPPPRNLAPLAAAAGFVLGGLVAGFVGGGEGGGPPVSPSVPPKNPATVKGTEALVERLLNVPTLALRVAPRSALLVSDELNCASCVDLASSSSPSASLQLLRLPAIRTAIQMRRELSLHEYDLGTSESGLAKLFRRVSALPLADLSHVFAPPPTVQEPVGNLAELAQSSGALTQEPKSTQLTAWGVESRHVVQRMASLLQRIPIEEWKRRRSSIKRSGGVVSPDFALGEELSRLLARLLFAAWNDVVQDDQPEAWITVDVLFVVLETFGELALTPIARVTGEYLSSMPVVDPAQAMVLGLYWRALAKAGMDHRWKDFEEAFELVLENLDTSAVEASYLAHCLGILIERYGSLGRHERAVKLFHQHHSSLERADSPAQRVALTAALDSLAALGRDHPTSREIGESIRRVGQWSDSGRTWGQDLRDRIARFGEEP